MLRLRVILVVLFIFSGDVQSANCKPNYYWRDYYGKIPSDSFVAGRTKSGVPFYIGQVYIPGKELLVATISPGEAEVTASAYNAVLHARKNIKILCTPSPENFEWVQMESKNLQSIGKHLVIGGSEVNQPLHVGRVFHNNYLTLGKIFKHSQPNRGIWIPSHKNEANYLSYDILVYNC